MIILRESLINLRKAFNKHCKVSCYTEKNAAYLSTYTSSYRCNELVALPRLSETSIFMPWTRAGHPYQLHLVLSIVNLPVY